MTILFQQNHHFIVFYSYALFFFFGSGGWESLQKEYVLYARENREGNGQPLNRIDPRCFSELKHKLQRFSNEKNTQNRIFQFLYKTTAIFIALNECFNQFSSILKTLYSYKIMFHTKMLHGLHFWVECTSGFKYNHFLKFI